MAHIRSRWSDALPLMDNGPVSINSDQLLSARLSLRASASRLHTSRHAASGVVIYLASQHPLISEHRSGPRRIPGAEFQARIERSASLAHSFDQRGQRIAIVISGDLHRDDNGEPDATTLREAGIAGLKDSGVRDEWIVSVDTVQRYRPDGVYCTEDEVAIAAGVFRDDSSFGYLIGVCGQAQVLRVLLAAQNERVPMQVETPLVFRADGHLADPATFWHEPGKEALVNIPPTLNQPLDPQAALDMREALKAARTPDAVTTELS